MIEYAINVVLGFVVLTTCGYVLRKISEYNKILKANNEGTKAIIKSQILKKYEEYHEEKGYMPIYAKECLTDMYKEYKNLGGNGIIDDLYNRLLALPTMKKRKSLD